LVHRILNKFHIRGYESVHHNSNQIKSNLFAINKVHNITVHKITFHLAGQTGDSFALIDVTHIYCEMQNSRVW